ncbi:MAG: hypothetical protein LBD14_02735 [Puniceicoccales bacterium]|jgi:hypothetical protein|nr:hypothetical protein [Puniceicoccales bacterium]
MEEVEAMIGKLSESSKKDNNSLLELGKDIINSLSTSPLMDETKSLQPRYNHIRTFLDAFLFDISIEKSSDKKMSELSAGLNNFLFEKDSVTQKGPHLPAFVDSLNKKNDEDQVLDYNRRVIIDETQIILNEFIERLNDIMKINKDKFENCIERENSKKSTKSGKQL